MAEGTQIGSAYVEVICESEKVRSGMAEVQTIVKSGMAATTQTIASEVSKQNAILATQTGVIKSEIGMQSAVIITESRRATMAQMQMYANLMQRAITVFRAIRRLAVVALAPLIATSAYAFKAFSDASTKESNAAMKKFREFKVVVRSSLADAFNYALTTTKIFGKTTFQWLEVISEKMKKISQQDIKNFVSSMKILIMTIASLKFGEMWLMLFRYATQAALAVNKYSKALWGAAAAQTALNVSSGLSAAKYISPGVLPRTGKPNRYNEVLISSARAGDYNRARISGIPAPKPGAMNMPLPSSMTILGSILSFLPRFVVVLGRLTIIGTIVGVLLGAISKLAGFSSIAEGMEVAFKKLGGVLSWLAKVVDNVTTWIAEGVITIGGLLHGVATGQIFSKSGRQQMAKDQQMAIDFFRSEQKKNLLPRMTPEDSEKVTELRAKQAEKNKDYMTERAELTGYRASGTHGNTMSGRAAVDYITQGQEEWQKGFLENQKRLLKLDEDKAISDKEFQKELITLTKSAYQKDYISNEKIAENTREAAIKQAKIHEILNRESQMSPGY